MSVFAERYKTSKNLEEEGVWVDFGDGIKVKLRRLNSAHSRKTRAKLEKPYVAQFRGRDYPNDLQETLIIKQLAQSVVIDWEGVEDADGTKAPATPESIEKVLSEIKDFRDDILTASMERSTFQEEDRKKVAEHLGESSNGNSSQSPTSSS